MDVTLILASSSPRRRELLERVGVEVEVLPADVDERPRGGEEAVPYACRLAAAKAAAVSAGERWVLAADTVVEVDGEIFGKPDDVAEAQEMLGRLLGREHRVVTAFVLRAGSISHVGHVTTEVSMRPALDGELDAYLAAGEWRDKAGGYAIQGMAAAFVLEVRGSVTNVIGLPLAEVLPLLVESGAARPTYRSAASPEAGVTPKNR